MAYNGEGVNALTCAFDDLQKSNIFSIDLHLRAILKCLAYYGEFRAVLEWCNRGFDYQVAKRNAMGKVGDSYVFRLPKNQKSLVALVAGMLVEFDAGDMDVITFACAHFPAKTRQDSFMQFFTNVLEPFKIAVASFVWNGIKEEPGQVRREIALAPDGLSQQTESLVVSMSNAVKESNLSEDERREFIVMLEGFAAALDAKDVLLIRAIWYGLSRALAQKKLCGREVNEISGLLGMYLAVK